MWGFGFPQKASRSSPKFTNVGLTPNNPHQIYKMYIDNFQGFKRKHIFGTKIYYYYYLTQIIFILIYIKVYGERFKNNIF